MWLGVRSTTVDNFQYVDGTSQEFGMHIESSRITNTCVRMSTSSHNWYHEDCNNYVTTYACERPSGTSIFPHNIHRTISPWVIYSTDKSGLTPCLSLCNNLYFNDVTSSVIQILHYDYQIALLGINFYILTIQLTLWCSKKYNCVQPS